MRSTSPGDNATFPVDSYVVNKGNKQQQNEQQTLIEMLQPYKICTFHT